MKNRKEKVLVTTAIKNLAESELEHGLFSVNITRISCALSAIGDPRNKVFLIVCFNLHNAT